MAGSEEWESILAMGRKDLGALELFEHTKELADEIFGFHAQQAAEKALKAWISRLGGEYPPTHDLGKLIPILERLGIDPTPLWPLTRWTSFAVQFRYDGAAERQRTSPATGDRPVLADPLPPSPRVAFRRFLKEVRTPECPGHTLEYDWDKQECLGDTPECGWDRPECLGDTLEYGWNTRECLGDTPECGWDKQECLGDILECARNKAGCPGDIRECVGDAWEQGRGSVRDCPGTVRATV